MLGDAELHAVPHRAAHDFAKHVAAEFVRRHHPVGNQEGGCARVIRDNAHRHVVRAHRAAIFLARHLSEFVEDGAEQIGVVIRLVALKDRGNALEAHAGVDRWCGQRLERAVGLPVELHEYVVPDFDIPAATALDTPADGLWAGDLVAAEVINLRASPAWTRFAHLPEVVIRAKFRQMVLGDVLQPELPGLDVPRDAAFTFEDGDEKLVLRNLPDAGQQFPREPDRLFLEVVTERKVAEHLEKRVMAGRRSYVFEVVVLAADAHALLAARRARVIALFLAEEDVLELVHSRVGEQQRRIVVRDERRAGHDTVSVPLEILQKRRANLSPGHRGALFYCGTTTA